MATTPSPRVLAVSRDAQHRFAKNPDSQITLLEGLGVEGDAHAGVTVQHRSRMRVDPTQPNLRQVHLIHSELFDEVAADGFEVTPGDLGENVTTTGIDLLALPTGTVLRLGDQAAVRITGLRNPCTQINGHESGLMKRLVTKDASGRVIRLAGVMGVVLAGGVVTANDDIRVELPAEPHNALDVV